MNDGYCNFEGVKGLNLAHLNIRSLWNKFDVVKQTILNSGLNFISFSESWLNSYITDNLIEIVGYVCMHDRTWLENNTVKKSGGICCYVRNNICVSHAKFIDSNVSSKDIEVFWVSLIIPNCKKIIIGNVYRPPQGNVKSFCDTLDAKLECIKSNQGNNYEIFILGDFNINYNVTNSQDTKQLKDASTLIYKSMILSYLDYGDIFYINANQNQHNKLFFFYLFISNYHQSYPCSS